MQLAANISVFVPALVCAVIGLCCLWSKKSKSDELEKIVYEEDNGADEEIEPNTTLEGTDAPGKQNTEIAM